MSARRQGWARTLHDLQHDALPCISLTSFEAPHRLHCLTVGTRSCGRGGGNCIKDWLARTGYKLGTMASCTNTA